MEGSKEITFFSDEVVEDPVSIATGTSSPGTTFCRQPPEKTVCFHLSSTLLAEIPKRQSFRMKVV